MGNHQTSRELLEKLKAKRPKRKTKLPGRTPQALRTVNCPDNDLSFLRKRESQIPDRVSAAEAQRNLPALAKRLSLREEKYGKEEADEAALD